MDSTISVIWGKASEALQKTETFNSDIVEKTAGREAPLKNENADLKSQIDKLKEEIATLKKSRSKAR
jgi:cell division protein FtsB